VGISDGVNAEISGELKEGTQVVTGVTQTAAASSTTTGSPLLPFGGRGFGNRGGQRGGGQNAPAGGRR
jgi:hypothetical protein